jgi:hypothetical protein
MPSKLFWISRVKNELSIADLSVFDVALYQTNLMSIAQRIWVLSRYIGDNKKYM